MSVQNIKPYFRARMLALGYDNEHEEAFDTTEIPSTRIDNAFHILLGNLTGLSNNQNHQEILVPVGLQMFFKAYRVEEDGRLLAMSVMENIIKECCTASNRVTQASDGIKDVRFLSGEAVPMDASQDNITLLQMEFEVLYMLDFE